MEYFFTDRKFTKFLPIEIYNWFYSSLDNAKWFVWNVTPPFSSFTSKFLYKTFLHHTCSTGMVYIDIECPDATKDILLLEIHFNLVELAFSNHESDPSWQEQQCAFPILYLPLNKTIKQIQDIRLPVKYTNSGELINLIMFARWSENNWKICTNLNGLWKITALCKIKKSKFIKSTEVIENSTVKVKERFNIKPEIDFNKKQIILRALELHKPIRKKFSKKQINILGIDDLWVADLVLMRDYTDLNDG